MSPRPLGFDTVLRRMCFLDDTERCVLGFFLARGPEGRSQDVSGTTVLPKAWERKVRAPDDKGAG